MERSDEAEAGGEVVRESVDEKQAEGVARGEGERVRLVLVEALQVGGTERPVVVQPPQGQGVGAPLPAGQ